eukprot:11651675-Prorocentrum_lima.AAC.1
MVKEADGIEFSGCYWQRVDLCATTFQLTKEGGPPLESIVARSTINVDTGETFENERIILNESYEDLTMALPIEGKSDPCTLRTI